MIIGLLLGNIHSSLGWIFAAAAGMFLYIAFVDMVPELSVGPPNAVQNLTLQFLGVFIGVLIMLIIAIYEHDLKHIIN
ncbi:SLC39A6 [Cordylochernes scorpioides]|nr:SLC39A6 [Cordylochernes scorpioides]